MQRLWLAAALFGLALSAHPQLVTVDVQVMPQVNETFWIRVNYPCPPPGGAPPPLYCDGGVWTTVSTSDARAQKPAAPVWLKLNQPFLVGPFKFRSAGTGYVELRANDGSNALVAVVQFEVQPRR